MSDFPEQCPKCKKRFANSETFGTPYTCPDCGVTLQMTTPTQEQVQAAVAFFHMTLRLHSLSTITKQHTETVLDALESAQKERDFFKSSGAQLMRRVVTMDSQIADAQKDKDCWLFNAQELQKQVNDLEKQIVELRDALEKYGGHLKTCAAREYWELEMQCTCGFDTAKELLKGDGKTQD